MQMNQTEQTVADMMGILGQDVMRPSWPDFLLTKKVEEKWEFKFVEVKRLGERVSRNQKKTFEMLKDLGFPVEVIILNALKGTYQSYMRLPEKLHPSVKRGSQGDFLQASPKPFIPKDGIFG